MKIKFYTVLFVLAVTLLLSGCATTYQPKGFFSDGGYTESRIGANTYKVSFECNENTSEAVCDGYLFRRCAELTLNAGYDYFIMTEHTSDIFEKAVAVPGHYEKVTKGSGSHRTTETKFTPGYVLNQRCPLSNATISMYRGARPDNIQNAFDARGIVQFTK